MAHYLYQVQEMERKRLILEDFGEAKAEEMCDISNSFYGFYNC